MEQQNRSISQRFTVPCICGIVLVILSLTTCSQSSNWPAEQPVAVAAQTVSQPESETGLPSQPFIAVAKQAKAAVVNVSSVKKPLKRKDSGAAPPFFDDPFLRRFFGEEFERRLPPGPEQREEGLGSGVIVSPDGYIVTNNHVIEGADELVVSLPDKRTFKAKVSGIDPRTDVAVIKIDASHLPVLPWGDAARLQVGEMVLAVGNPFGLNQTVTMGIISAVGRANMGIVDYEDFIQTDAAINPGNSGGGNATIFLSIGP